MVKQLPMLDNWSQTHPQMRTQEKKVLRQNIRLGCTDLFSGRADAADPPRDVRAERARPREAGESCSAAIMCFVKASPSCCDIATIVAASWCQLPTACSSYFGTLFFVLRTGATVRSLSMRMCSSMFGMLPSSSISPVIECPPTHTQQHMRHTQASMERPRHTNVQTRTDRQTDRQICSRTRHHTTFVSHIHSRPWHAGFSVFEMNLDSSSSNWRIISRSPAKQRAPPNTIHQGTRGQIECQGLK